MPFTLAHPLIILPFLKARIWDRLFAVLVIGAMSPDFEYFLAMRFSGEHHSILGQFTFCLPITIAVWILWEYIIAPVFVHSVLKRNYESLSLFKKWFTFPLLVLGALIGSFSHIFFDSFTHVTGYFVQLYPHIFLYPIAGIPVYSILQHGMSLVGLVIIGGLLYRMAYKHHVRIYLNNMLMKLSIAFSALSITAMFLFSPSHFSGFGSLLITVIPLVFYSILLASIITYKKI